MKSRGERLYPEQPELQELLQNPSSAPLLGDQRTPVTGRCTEKHRVLGMPLFDVYQFVVIESFIR